MSIFSSYFFVQSPVNINLNQKNRAIRDCLYFACENLQLPIDFYPKKDKEIVQILLAQPNIDLNAKNDTEKTPLHLACRNQHQQIVELLLAQPSIDINAVDENGQTPLHFACRNRNPQIVDLLLAQPLTAINAVDENGWTPLHYACRNWNEEIVELLLAQPSIDINAVDEKGSTPLHYACRAGSKEILRLFLDHSKINIHAVDRNGQTAIDIFWDYLLSDFTQYVSDPRTRADESYNYGTLMWLDAGCAFLNAYKKYFSVIPQKITAFFSSDGSLDLLLGAIKNNCLNLTRFLLEPFLIYGKEVNFHQLLHLACITEHQEIVRLLLAQPQIDVNAIDENGHTPLHSASYKESPQIAQLLLAKPEININAADKSGRTPLHVACYSNTPQTIQFLLSQPTIDINAADENGKTPLNLFCSRVYLSRHEKIILQHLLSHPTIDINAADDSGKTPLHVACERNHIKSIPLLLDHSKIDINAIDANGETPLHLACRKEHIKIIQFLLDHPQIDINALDKNGETLLYLAVKNCDLDTPYRLLLHPSIKLNIKSHRSFFSIAQEKEYTDITDVLTTCFGIDENTPEQDGIIKAQHSVLSYVLGKDNGDKTGTYWGYFKKIACEQSRFLSSRLFGLTVFLCDDFFKINPDASDPTSRFFKIAQQLPIELQMILANRAFSSMKNNILTKDSEAAFKYLAKNFL